MEKPFSSPNFRNITVSGRAGNGATTLSKALSEKLGWELINAGELVRIYMKEEGVALELTSQTPDKYHLDLDNFIKEKLKKEDQLIIESWLSGFDAQGIPGVLKIFVDCSNDAIRIDRLMNRDKMTIREAKKHLKTREEENVKKWEKLYHTRDFWNPKLYNFTIDTYQHGPSETLELTLKAIGYYNNK